MKNEKKLIVVDVEADGPCPGTYSMVCFGAVVVEPGLNRTFYGKTRPLDDTIFDPDALKISGFSRQQHLEFPASPVTMNNFDAWIKKLEVQPIFISDNPAFDWQFINYYFHNFGPRGNPFGFSARRIGDLYAGMQADMRAGWKHLRVTKHTHNPVDDAMGNAEALLAMAGMGLKGIL